MTNRELVPVGVRRQEGQRELEQMLALPFEDSLEDIDAGRVIQNLAGMYRAEDDCFGLVALGELWGTAALWQRAADAPPAIVSALLDNSRETYQDASQAYQKVVIAVPDFGARLNKYLAAVGRQVNLNAEVADLSPLEIGAIEEEAKVTDKVTAFVVPEFSLLKVVGKLEAHYKGIGDFFGLKAVSDVWRTVAEQRQKTGMPIEIVIDGYEKAREASNAALCVYLSQSKLSLRGIEPYLLESLRYATDRISLLGRIPNDMTSVGEALPQHAEPVLAGR
ncbi:hypothetical protein HYU20_03100 [Candidatus Woesearchaeota archaeon]|nr:hypothetical protein [Candidatus Woesearchaeota archaeon]